MKSIDIQTFDNHPTKFYFFDQTDKTPKGIVQIVHGMNEHIGRYSHFIEFLNSNGFIVVAEDHRANGTTASFGNVGKYEGKQTFFDTLKDVIALSQYAKQNYPNLALVLFGHSYGSYILQKYMQEYNDFDMAILSGSNYAKSLLNSFARRVAYLTVKLKGDNAPAKFITHMGFEKFDKKLKGSWLSTDQDEVEKHKSDKLCTRYFGAKFYYDMFFATTKSLYTKIGLQNISKDKPILLISGDQDLSNNRAKGLNKLYKIYKKNDLKVEIKVYKGARHELLFEKPQTKQMVMDDILNFITTYI